MKFWRRVSEATDQTEGEEQLRLEGISRVTGQDVVMVLHFNRTPTDHEVYGVFDTLWKFVNG